MLVCLRVVDPAQRSYGTGTGIDTLADDLASAGREAAEEMFDEVRERVEEAGADIETELRVGRPARAIEECAEGASVDHVVIGSHGRDSITRILLGSVAETVVRRSPVPVTVVR